jgi:hypothetical protein
MEISMETIVAAYCAIFGDDNQLLIFRPAKTSNRAFVPVEPADELASTRVDVDAGFGD